jgi:hypothetical protein
MYDMKLSCSNNLRGIYLNTVKTGTIQNTILNAYLEGLFLKLTPDTFVSKFLANQISHLFLSEVIAGLNDPVLIGMDCTIEIIGDDKSKEIQIRGIDTNLILKRRALLPELKAEILPSPLEVRWLSIGKMPRYRMPIKFIISNFKQENHDNNLSESDNDE